MSKHPPGSIAFLRAHIIDLERQRENAEIFLRQTEKDIRKLTRKLKKLEGRIQS